MFQAHGAHVAHMQTHQTMQHLSSETPFSVDSRGLTVDVENYCSDLTTPCTIKTEACGFGAGIFISCDN